MGIESPTMPWRRDTRMAGAVPSVLITVLQKAGICCMYSGQFSPTRSCRSWAIFRISGPRTPRFQAMRSSKYWRLWLTSGLWFRLPNRSRQRAARSGSSDSKWKKSAISMYSDMHASMSGSLLHRLKAMAALLAFRQHNPLSWVTASDSRVGIAWASCRCFQPVGRPESTSTTPCHARAMALS
jgi:hypothetical protein